jgi:CheY-like chemotaxis protein
MIDATPVRSVLVVDDDCDLRELVADVVLGSGRCVFTARDGTDALQQLEGDGIPRPCIVLLDWFMRPMGGGVFLEHLGARPDASGIRVVLVSANGGSAPADAQSRVVASLRKPFGVEELLAVLDRYD